METRAHFILIGIFTLSVMVGAALFVLWLGKYTDQEYAYYAVVFNEPVTGLSIGGAVQYNGIQIGEVDGLSLAPDNPSRVVARVKVVADTPIKEDTRAQLGFMGVTGVALIQLSGGSVESPRLLAEEGQALGVIVADVSNLQRLIEGGGDVFANVNELLLRLNRVFADENISSFSASISHIEQVAASLADEKESLQSILREGAAATASLERILARFDRASGDIETLVDGLDSELATHMNQLIIDARSSAAQLEAFSRQLTELMTETQPHVAQFGRQGLAQIQQTFEQLKQLGQRLESIARRLEENPSGFLLNTTSAKEYEPGS